MVASDGGGDDGREIAVGALIVVVIGGGSVLGAAQTSNTGPILAFIGALLVALITWFAADRRQRYSLAAEKARLDLQLSHERRLNDVEHLRDLLDEAIAAYEAVLDKTTELLVRSQREDVDADTWWRLFNAVGDAQYAVVLMNRRLLLRFPPGASLVQSFDTIRSAFLEAFNEQLWVDVPYEPEKQATINACVARGRSAFIEFSEAARELIGPEADSGHLYRRAAT